MCLHMRRPSCVSSRFIPMPSPCSLQSSIVDHPELQNLILLEPNLIQITPQLSRKKSLKRLSICNGQKHNRRKRCALNPKP